MTALHPLDVAVATSLPLVAATRHAPLPELAVGTKRLVVACNGLFIEVRSPALHACLPVSEVTGPLPYGEATSFICLAAGPVPQDFLRASVARAVAAYPNETAFAVVRAGQGYAFADVPIDSSSHGHVRYTDTLDDDALVFDVHTHGAYTARFSAQDDESDRSRRGPYISLVLGTAANPASTTLGARFSCSPYLIDLHGSQLQQLGVIA